MGKQLAITVPPSIAVALDATTPAPAGVGAVIWSTTTSCHLRWDGTAWRRLVEGSLLNRDLTNVRNMTFNSELDDGNSSTAITIAWASGARQKVTLTANATFTFSAPPGPCNLLLKVVQDGTGSRTVTWPGSVTWVDGVAPTLSKAAGSVDFIGFYYDGTTYWGSYSRPKLLLLAGENDNGNSGTAKTIAWDNGAFQKVTLTGNCTFTFTAPSPAGVGRLQLKITQDATGSRAATWPAAVKWAGGTPTLSTAANAVDVATFYWDGTNYWGSLSKAFA